MRFFSLLVSCSPAVVWKCMNEQFILFFRFTHHLSGSSCVSKAFRMWTKWAQVRLFWLIYILLCFILLCRWDMLRVPKCFYKSCSCSCVVLIPLCVMIVIYLVHLVAGSFSTSCWREENEQNEAKTFWIYFAGVIAILILVLTIVYKNKIYVFIDTRNILSRLKKIEELVWIMKSNPIRFVNRWRSEIMMKDISNKYLGLSEKLSEVSTLSWSFDYKRNNIRLYNFKTEVLHWGLHTIHCQK